MKLTRSCEYREKLHEKHLLWFQFKMWDVKAEVIGPTAAGAPSLLIIQFLERRLHEKYQAIFRNIREILCDGSVGS